MDKKQAVEGYQKMIRSRFGELADTMVEGLKREVNDNKIDRYTMKMFAHAMNE